MFLFQRGVNVLAEMREIIFIYFSFPVLILIRDLDVQFILSHS